MERDGYSRLVYPLRVYLQAVESVGGIVEASDALDAAARRPGVILHPPSQRG